MAADGPKYAYNIPSLSQSIPTLPALRNLDVNAEIRAETPIDLSNLRDAKIAAKKLRATLDSANNPGITEEMAELAEFRARAVEDAHVAAVYAPGFPGALAALADTLNTHFNTINTRFDTMDAHFNARFDAMDARFNARFDAMDARFDAMDARFDAMDARFDARFDAMDARFDAIDARFNANDARNDAIEARLVTMDGRLDTLTLQTEIHTAILQNNTIVQQNIRTQPTAYIALRKTIPGNGYERAYQLAPTVPIRDQLAVPAVPDRIGAQPFPGVITTIDYNDLEICRLIIFYNSDFGIVEGDSIQDRRFKLLAFWVNYSI